MIIIIIIIITIKYTAYQQDHGLAESTYVRLINCRFHIFSIFNFLL